MTKTKDWLNEFIEKNVWSILILLATIIIFYTKVDTNIKAQDTRLDKLETSFSDVIQIQKDIIIIQQKQNNSVEDIGEIKGDLKDIKKALKLDL